MCSYCLLNKKGYQIMSIRFEEIRSKFKKKKNLAVISISLGIFPSVYQILPSRTAFS